MFKQRTTEFNAEVEAEVNMLKEVLLSAGLCCNPEEVMSNTEYRTFLISRLKHVPGIIESLMKENRELKQVIDEKNKRIKGLETK